MSGLKFYKRITAETEADGTVEEYEKLPIGVQDFEFLRKDNYLYVDKTKYIYELVHSGKQYFLSRPRRFGKSLFLSTLSAYWQAKKELFSGLDIERLEREGLNEWTSHPVLYFDFNKDRYDRENALEDVLEEHIKKWEKKYDCKIYVDSLAERFRNVIDHAVENNNGKKVVILVDEYDKPLLENSDNQTLQDYNKSVFKGFFSTLKSYDKQIQFALITGVTRFSKVSIFSDLNQLQDISMDKAYSDLCGITDDELDRYFQKTVTELARDYGYSYEECRKKMKDMYDGYHFHHSSRGVYNPFSVISSLKAKEFGEYWFSTATPSFLMKRLKDQKYDITQFTSKDFYVKPRNLIDYMQDNSDPIPLLYQTGYLTIKGYDNEYEMCRLEYPNDEVKYAFLDTIMPFYLDKSQGSSAMDIRGFDKEIESADFESIKKRLNMIFKRIPYPSTAKFDEWNFQIVVYLVFALLGKFVNTEIHTLDGRIDCIVETRNHVYVFEFKVDKSAEEAIHQIKEKKYCDIYGSDKRNIYAIGVNFDSNSKCIAQDGWLVKRANDL